VYRKSEVGISRSTDRFLRVGVETWEDSRTQAMIYPIVII